MNTFVIPVWDIDCQNKMRWEHCLLYLAVYWLKENNQSSLFQLCSLCLFAFQQLPAIDKRWKWVPEFVFFSPFFSLHILYKLRDARPILFFSLFCSYSSWGYTMQEYIENDDHHIVFDVTIDVCMRVPSRFFSQQACIVRSRSSLFVSYIFFLFNMQARKKKRTGLIVLYTLLIGHC